MPTLLELQTAMRQSLVHRDIAAVSAMLAAHVVPDRLDIYRNTFILTLTKALRLCFPAVQKLVGEEFFEGATQVFIAERPPALRGSTNTAPNFLTFSARSVRRHLSRIWATWRSWSGR